jgi:hypothetical protein
MKQYLLITLFGPLIIMSCNNKSSNINEEYTLTETDIKIPIQTASNGMKANSTLQDTLKIIIAQKSDTAKTSNVLVNVDEVLDNSNMKMQLAELKVQNNTAAFSDYLSSVEAFNFNEASSDLSVKKGKYPDFTNEALPKSFTDRVFIKNLAAFTYDIFQLPGNIVEILPDSTLRLKTLVALTKNNYIPKQTALENEIIYDNKINDKASFNGSFIIGGLSIE